MSVIFQKVITDRKALNELEFQLKKINVLKEFLRSSSYKQFRIHILREFTESTRGMDQNDSISVYCGGSVKMTFTGLHKLVIQTTQPEFWGHDFISFLDVESADTESMDREFTGSHGESSFSSGVGLGDIKEETSTPQTEDVSQKLYEWCETRRRAQETGEDCDKPSESMECDTSVVWSPEAAIPNYHSLNPSLDREVSKIRSSLDARLENHAPASKRVCRK